MNNAWMDSKKPLVNGAMLATTPSGNVVTLLGKVVTGSADRSGKSVTVQTCDGQSVQIKFEQPLTEPLNGYIEVNGKVLNKKELICLNFVSLSDDVMRNFDMNIFNQVIEGCQDIF